MTTWTKAEQAEHRRLWVEALRSGKYQQAKGMLSKDGGFCCLGVACDVSGLGVWSDDVGYPLYIIDEDDRGEEYLPRAVQAWLGLSSKEGNVATDYALYELNDDHDKTFSEIADIIESEPEGLLAPEAT